MLILGLKEEVNSNACAVSDIPLDELRSPGEDCVRASANNADGSSKDETLVDLFKAPHNDVWHTLLPRNHITLLVRAFSDECELEFGSQ